MKRFLIKIILFFVVVAAVDVAFGLVMGRLNLSAKGGDTANNARITTEVEAPVLVAGSSRAIHHYSPEVLEEALGSEVYNIGVDGNGILSHYARIAMMAERYTPRLIIYDVMPAFDIRADDHLKYLGVLKRWTGHAPVDSVIADVAPDELLMLRSALYRYNGAFVQIVSDNIKPQQEISYHGFKAYDGVMDAEMPAKNYGVSEWDPLKLKYFGKLIELCRERGIELVLAMSPAYKAPDSSDFDLIRRLGQAEGVRVIDMYRTAGIADRRDYFADPAHLNVAGAEAFSRAFADSLKILH